MEKIYGSFSEFQLALNRDYGVPYGTGDVEFQTSDILVEDPWVICPNCGEPINMIDCIGDGLDYWDCPVCNCVRRRGIRVMEFQNKATNEELVSILAEISKDDKIPFIYRMAAREARNVIIEDIKLTDSINEIFAMPWEVGDEV